MRIGKWFYLPVFTFLLYNYEKVIYGVAMDSIIDIDMNAFYGTSEEFALFGG